MRGEGEATLTVPPAPTGAQVQLWSLALPLTRGEADGLATVLDAGEQERVRRLRRPEDKLRFVAAHGLLRAVLGHQRGVDARDLVFASRCPRCGPGDHGKPELVEPAGARTLHLSLSHAGELVAVALTRLGPIGVDVELIDAVAPLAAEPGSDVLSADERARFTGLAAAERTKALAALWTRKEAVLKATGDGLQVSPADLTLSADAPVRLLTWTGRTPPPPAVALTDWFPADGYRGCVAVLAGVPPDVVECDGRQLLSRWAG